jgi:hypothetical protein
MTNVIKVLLQRQSGFLQLESTLVKLIHGISCDKINIDVLGISLIVRTVASTEFLTHWTFY